MRLAILTEHYPSMTSPRPRAFIHARARLYLEFEQEILILSAPQKDLLENEVFEDVQIARPPGLKKAQLVIDSFSPDVIAIHFPYRGTFSTILAANLRNKYPLVAWIHGYEVMYTAFFGYHHGFSRLLSIPHDWLKLRYLQRFLAQCKSVVYVSNWIRCVAERSMQYDHPHSSIIANPVNTRVFAPLAKPRSTEKLRGVALRTLGPKYGLDIAVCAYAGLDTTDLTIIGTGPLEQRLRSLIAATGSSTTLHMCGFPHARIPEVLNRYDYFVAPSRNETQGLAMCEAMSCGLPVVATCVGGIPEFVRDGIDGYLVEPENPTALRDAVLQLVKEPDQCRKMGRNARQHILDTCNGRKIVAKELEVFRRAYDEMHQRP